MSKVELQHVAGGLLALTSVAVAVTCAASGTLGRAPSVEGASVSSGATSPSAAGGGQASAASAPARPPADVAAGTGGKRIRLPRLCAALQGLASGERERHVRVLWWGDSHTYADFLTDAVRGPLQKQYGNGGPGFLHLGVDGYRHASVRVEVGGDWRLEPRAPSRSLRSGDGVFGLGGMRAVPEDSNARTGVQLLSGAVSGKAQWELTFRLPDQAAGFRVRVDAGKPRTFAGRSGAGRRVQSAKLSGKGDGQLELSECSGHPQLLGVSVESSEPGVVLDTLGINGARAATPLAWEEAHFRVLVGAREPDLVVIAYGTNEIFDDREPERYAKHYEELLARLRRASPDFDCLMIGPTDAAQSDGTTHPRVMAIDEVERTTAARLGCSYFSMFQAMGGEGSITRWAELDPPLATQDGVHLSRQGYRRVGAGIARWLLAACE